MELFKFRLQTRGWGQRRENKLNEIIWEDALPTFCAKNSSSGKKCFCNSSMPPWLEGGGTIRFEL
eukprot:scaffold2463_cov261-Chaetoceros_neogracile.AAC.5